MEVLSRMPPILALILILREMTVSWDLSLPCRCWFFLLWFPMCCIFENSLIGWICKHSFKGIKVVFVGGNEYFQLMIPINRGFKFQISLKRGLFWCVKSVKVQTRIQVDPDRYFWGKRVFLVKLASKRKTFEPPYAGWNSKNPWNTLEGVCSDA